MAARARAASKPDPLKKLKIKCNVCCRIEKEISFYQDEAKMNEDRVQGMKDDDKFDEYDVRKAEEVLGESYMMIPESKNRFQKSLDDLSVFLEEHIKEPAFKDTDELTRALKILSDNDMGTQLENDTALIAQSAAAEIEFKEGEIF
eukprot:CAMPEP_0185767776 /NCGR_PEP_ID=MMETSP1174-20130828/45551_1 /TAXON_ID=35687 /ORGANISM="Dictyocha speculum, Strain CCMP1381" /LENGTH=145 /DNA_ID=CAMNT_0028452121 /DNA_START=17 /DNA_END=454 /DNA_ORIENTATION=+